MGDHYVVRIAAGKKTKGNTQLEICRNDTVWSICWTTMASEKREEHMVQLLEGRFVHPISTACVIRTVFRKNAGHRPPSPRNIGTVQTPQNLCGGIAIVKQTLELIEHLREGKYGDWHS